MKFECVYRRHKNGEPIQSLFDTETGLIDGVPEEWFMYKLPPHIFERYRSDYKSELGIYKARLANALFYNPMALVAINYNGEAELLISENYVYSRIPPDVSCERVLIPRDTTMNVFDIIENIRFIGYNVVQAPNLATLLTPQLCAELTVRSGKKFIDLGRWVIKSKEDYPDLIEVERLVKRFKKLNEETIMFNGDTEYNYVNGVLEKFKGGGFNVD